MNYPDVADEFATIRKVLEGYNLARVGDGELKMSQGYGYRRQMPSAQLAQELSQTITRPHRRCIVGIPTMNQEGPKYANWERHRQRFISVLSPTVEYYSAFVSRPDSAPWIETPEYGDLVRQIWAGRHAAVLCEKGGSMYRAVKVDAKRVSHIRCPSHQAYDRIAEFEMAIRATGAEVAVLSCGPTATCLANRLARRGIHAVDMGSAGQFLLRVMR